MYKLVVLSVLLAAVAAKPGLFHAAVVPSPLVASHIVPSAVSHQTRVDVVSDPIVEQAVYATPVVDAAIHTPIFQADPIVHPVPSAVSHQTRTDIVSSPVVAHTEVVSPVIAKTAAYAPITAYSSPVLAPTAVHAPLLAARTYAAPTLMNHGYYGYGHLGYAGHGHLGYTGHIGYGYPYYY